jgi:hypothetical protein
VIGGMTLAQARLYVESLDPEGGRSRREGGPGVRDGRAGAPIEVKSARHLGEMIEAARRGDLVV